ncbi:MAG: AbrB/MazE/SpoVT family DNA-binding domain-containing protein [Thermomicrobiales bacterium]|nr:AbrB/MazE/SpoVT family DNA-binding domain-containing protein [Thermomicrobiales bacterium]MCO5220671.1 AbrB/MazE/SpoVT family DNA-binding domain-containing protein [Thermomicrobiales bacterium]
MTATYPKSKQTATSKVYRAKVTGRHAITLPAELCRQLGIEVGDTIELEIQGEKAELRPAREPRIYSLEELRGILRPLYRDWDDIQQHIRELRDEWDDHPELEDVPLSNQVHE